MNEKKWEFVPAGLLALSGLLFLVCLFVLGLFPWPAMLLVGLIALIIGSLAGGFFWYWRGNRRLRWVFGSLCLLCTLLYGLGTAALLHTSANLQGKDAQAAIPVEIRSGKHGLKEIRTVGYLAGTQQMAVQQCADQLKAEGFSVRKKPFESLENLVYAERQGKIQGILLTGSSMEQMELDANEDVRNYLKDSRLVYQYEYDPLTGPVVQKEYDLSAEPFQVLVSGKDGETSEVNVLLGFQPEKSAVLVTVLPAETYVEAACPDNYACPSGEMDVLTNMGLHSTETTRSTVEKLLDTRIQYSLRTDLDGLRQMVNALGGIPLESADGSFWLPEGDVDADMVVWFLQHRQWAGGNGRLEDAAAVVQAVVEKLTESGKEDIGAAMEQVLSDLSPAQVQALASRMQEKDRKWSFQVQILEGEQGQAVSAESGQDVTVLVPDETSLDKTKEAVQKSMGKG